MPRAMETAEIIQPALNLDKLHLDSELVEHRPGEADGKPYENYKPFSAKATITEGLTASSLQAPKAFHCSITVSPQH